MQRVFVLDKNAEPLMPCHPARTRILMRKGRAKVYRRYPFTIILVDREGSATQPIQAKFDPGSNTNRKKQMRMFSSKPSILSQ